ncbi:MAG: STT3 domain-containing protein [Candidatus Woesearchaeota archaeon]
MVKNNKFKTNWLLSSLAIEFILILVLIFSSKVLVPLPKNTLSWISILSIIMISNIVYLYFLNKEFYQTHKKKFDVTMAVILILISMLFTGYIRSYSYNIPMADNWADNYISNSVKNQIYSNIQKQYPNLPPETIAKDTEEEYKKLLEQEPDKFTKEKQDIANSLRDKFQAENGQTYFLAIDPYHYHTLSKNLLENGHKGDIIDEDGDSILTRKLAPNGVKVNQFDFHPWLEAQIYKFNGLDENSTTGERTKAVYFLPAFISMLAVLFLFLIVKRYAGNLFAFFSALSFSIVSTFLSRTQAGFVDTDAYNVFFPMLILFLIIYALTSDKTWKIILYSTLAGLAQLIFLMAWGNGWFSFLFIITALLGYIIYTYVAELIEKKKLKQLTLKFNSELITLCTYFISSVLFSALFFRNILTMTINELMNSSGGIALANFGNIWPNVLSSVAELNPASFATIIDSVGGKLIFLIALLGLLSLSLDFENKKDKYTLYKNILFGASLIWFSFFIINFENMDLFLKLQKSLISLTSNNPFIFLFLLFLPILIGLLFSLHNTNADKKTFLTMLLGIWMGVTIYMSFNGVRFVLLLAPGFAIAFGMGLFYIAKFLNKYIPKILDIEDINLSKYIGVFLVIILFMFTFIPSLTLAHDIGMGTVPNFDDDWYNLMYKIRDNSAENAIITSWWDFGHFFISIGERGATFDGGSQTTPQSHWVGKLLMENNENVSLDILRMLSCGGNKAFEVMIDKTNDSTKGVLVNKVLYSTFGVEDKQKVLQENKYFEFSNQDITEILEKLDCENPPETFVITSEDMVGKAGVWAHWGSWDFSRKYILDNYKNGSAKEIANLIDEDETWVAERIDELNNIDLRAELEDIKRSDLINYWLAPYPSYVQASSGYWIPCVKTQNKLNCQNVIEIDLEKVEGKLSASNPAFIVNKLLIYDGTFKSKVQNSNGNTDLVVLNSNNQYNVLLANNPLGESLFTKLFYLNANLENFEKFDYSKAANGWDIFTWKVKWD